MGSKPVPPVPNLKSREGTLRLHWKSGWRGRPVANLDSTTLDALAVTFSDRGPDPDIQRAIAACYEPLRAAGYRPQEVRFAVAGYLISLWGAARVERSGAVVRMACDMAEKLLPEQLRCTGIAARWCPVHGNCTCSAHENWPFCIFAENCPLHGPDSDHAEGEHDA